MMVNMRIAAIIFVLCLLPACLTVHTKEAGACAASRMPLEPYKTDGIRLSLPPGSKLTAENTIDARYWVWQTSAGNVSVIWIGGIARDEREAGHKASCIIDGKNAQFKVYSHTNKVVAISDALIQNGAGLLVEVESSNAGFSFPIALSIIESIQVTTE
jgi:hypothetical protein